jgi:two-component system chemotaxis response regulator CheY
MREFYHQGFQRMRVLIVDDSKTARIMCKRVLPASLQHDLLEASGGEEALSTCRAQSIDIMFLDLTMPDVDGYQVLEILQNEGLAKPKVIVMSADVQSGAQERIQKLGAIGFLRKPSSSALVAQFLQEHGLL